MATNPLMRRFQVHSICWLLLTCSAAADLPVPDRGIYALWYSDDLSILETPYVTGGQIVCQWREVEPRPGQYDFSVVGQQLAELHATGRKATIQINGNQKPEWLFKKVPHTPKRLSVQVRDEQGTLMYWHPTHRDAYLDMLKGFSEFLSTSPHRDTLIGMRLNFNPVGTEHLSVPDDYRTAAAWTVPSGVEPGVDHTQQVVLEYQDAVVTTFIEQLSPYVKIFVRNTIKPEIEERYRHLFDTGKIGWFHTSSEAEPRSTGLEYKYIRFHMDCRSGTTVGYAEPWASAWGDHGGQEDHRPFSPPQWNYWRLLIDLHCGISFIGVYRNDLNVAIEGTYDLGDNHYDETVDGLNYQVEFARAFQFAARYAGYHDAPRYSPGAWVAFRDAPEILARNAHSPNQLTLNYFTGDYNFLMERLPDESIGVHNVGPDNQRFGAWARVLPAGKAMRVKADETFLESLDGAVIRITYLDEAQSAGGSFSMQFGDVTRVIERTGSGGWVTTRIPVDKPSSAWVSLTSGDHDLCLHMVEILRN